MNLQNLKKLFADNGCEKLYAKRLSPNDNSKNQVYLGGSFEVINILPISDIRNEEAGDWRRERFKASINFYWVDESGSTYKAPNAQLVLYPKYPEVRFSGFLLGCEKAPSNLMSQRLDGRFLFLGVTKMGNVLGYVSSPDSEISNELGKTKSSNEQGVLQEVPIKEFLNDEELLLNELRRIHELDWITAKRLNNQGSILPCNSPQCGGYTLEAELGITPNGYSEPDYLGWEIKQFGVKDFNRLDSTVITLMTPEPTHGIYKSEGLKPFLFKYGYPDKLGRPDRINFGGTHKIGKRHPSTALELQLIGFDSETGKIRNSNGRIALIGLQGEEAASWSFSSMLLHWNRKHNKACYVPSLSYRNGNRKYKYGDRVLLGFGTDFQLFLKQMALGNIYYDPGIKLENASAKPKVKARSQFRMKSKFLSGLYKKNELRMLS